MKMLELDNFLGCMTLETGGFVIGWLNAIFYFFSFLGSGLLLILISVFDCEDLSKMFKDEGGLDKDEMVFCSFGRFFIIVVCVFLMVMFAGFVVISYFCIKGTHRRNHIHVKPMMILMGVLTVLSFFDIFENTFTSLPTALAETILSAYQFVVLYSLYNKFLKEFTNGPTAYFQAPIEKAYFQPPIEKA